MNCVQCRRIVHCKLKDDIDEWSVIESNAEPNDHPVQFTDWWKEFEVQVKEEKLEAVWEYQMRENSKSTWSNDVYQHQCGIGAYRNEAGDVTGCSIEAVVQGMYPVGSQMKQWEWIERGWSIDQCAVLDCDEAGWIYGSSPLEFAHETENKPSEREAYTKNTSSLHDNNENLYRRRRHIRKRKINIHEMDPDSFSVIYSNFLTEMRYPLCHSCEEELIHDQERELNMLTEDLSKYEECLDIVDLPDSPRLLDCNGDADADVQLESHHCQQLVEIEVDRLPTKELLQYKSQFMDAIEKCQHKKDSVEAVREMLRAKAAELDVLLNEICEQCTRMEIDATKSNEEIHSVSIYSLKAIELLNRLQRYNVYNDAFHIWHDGQFGTINGLRLGRLPSKPVEWIEINAALGQTVLLLDILAKIVEMSSIKPDSPRLVPRGSYSRIIRATDQRELYLYSEGSFLRRRGFNQALVLLLECMDDLGQYAAQQDPTFKLPCKIDRTGKIGDRSICLGDDEEWTSALKYFLTHLKWLLAWVVKHKRVK